MGSSWSIDIEWVYVYAWLGLLLGVGMGPGYDRIDIVGKGVKVIRSLRIIIRHSVSSTIRRIICHLDPPKPITHFAGLVGCVRYLSLMLPASLSRDRYRRVV